MISFSYYKDDENRNVVESHTVDINEVETDLWGVMYYFVKVCETAGFYKESFDSIIKEAVENLEEGYGFKDYLSDCIMSYKEKI